MGKDFLKWIRTHYNNITGSIAFYPAIIALCFLLASLLMLEIDFSEKGKQIKENFTWLRLRDPSTARIIVSTIAAGVISMTVFTFSMVMVVLNQAAAQMSNRVLDNLIGNRFQQFVLGIFIGTTVFALFLLSSIRERDSGSSVPALSIYLLILLTIIDILLFIYFLHFITQTVKYQTIIHRIELQTIKAMDKCSTSHKKKVDSFQFKFTSEIASPETGYFQEINYKQLIKWAQAKDVCIELLHPRGSYLLKGAPFLILHHNAALDQQETDQLFSGVDFYHEQPIVSNPYFGFKHLAEVGIKALSPGINDPATAVISLEALAGLLAYFLRNPPQEVFEDEVGQPRVLLKERSFKELFQECIHAIWNYGKKDQYIQEALSNLLQQLKKADTTGEEASTFDELLAKVQKEKQLHN
jgi:uncharacterized membrane protein